MSKIWVAVGALLGAILAYAALYYDPALLLVPCFIFGTCS